VRERVGVCLSCGREQRIEAWQYELPHAPHCVYCGSPIDMRLKIQSRGSTERKGRLWTCSGCNLSFVKHVPFIRLHLYNNPECCREEFVAGAFVKLGLVCVHVHTLMIEKCLRYVLQKRASDGRLFVLDYAERKDMLNGSGKDSKTVVVKRDMFVVTGVQPEGHIVEIVAEVNRPRLRKAWVELVRRAMSKSCAVGFEAELQYNRLVQVSVL